MRKVKSALHFILLTCKSIIAIFRIRFTFRKNYWNLAKLFDLFHHKTILVKVNESCDSLSVWQSRIEQSNVNYWDSNHERYLAIRVELLEKGLNKQKLKNPTIFVGDEITNSFGHLAQFTDRCRARILGLDNNNFVISGFRRANSWFIDHYLSRYFSVLPPDELINEIYEIKYRDSMDQISLGYINGEVRSYTEVRTIIEREWKSNFGAASLFDLSETDALKFDEFMASIGMHVNDWFVTLHLRNAQYDRFRNSAEFDKFKNGIDEILRRGGWVINFGSVDTPILPINHPHFFDYANSGRRSEQLDICLLARCRFHFGTASGVSDFPGIFGRPVLRINGTRIGSLYYKPNTLEVPKILVNRNTQEYDESFSKHLNSGWLDVDHPPIARPDLELRNATEDEILNGVCEILLQESTTFDKENSAIDEILSKYRGTESTSISKYFIKKHEKYFC